MLAHLAALLVEDVAKAQHGLVRRLVEDEGADGHERVEPPARLVDRFGDEVRRIAIGEELLPAMRISELREGHRAAVVPRVDDLGDASGGAAALLAREGDVVDVGPVRVEGRQVRAGVLAELGQRSDAGEVPCFAAPDGQGSAPVAAAREGPVDVVVEPVAIATPLDRLRMPVGGLVLAQQRVLDRGRPDVPGRLRVVDQRRVAPPAVRVGVLVRHMLEQQPARLKVSDEDLISLLEEDATHERDVVVERAVETEGVDHGQAVLAAQREVLGTECRCLVNNS